MLAQLSNRLRSTLKLAQQKATSDSPIQSTQKAASGITSVPTLDANIKKHSQDHTADIFFHQPSKDDTQVTKLEKQDTFDIIDSTVGFRNTNHQFWWDKTGKQLAELLRYAGYTNSEQYNELLFFAFHVVPELGAAPDKSGRLQWRTPHTPDGTPLELSWEWGLEGKGTIRTGFEPIGPFAGTEIDPYNRHETDIWVKYLEDQGLVTGLDLEWYRHFTANVLPSKDTPPTEVDRAKLAKNDLFEVAPVGGTFVMRDIARSGPMIKAYMYPGLKGKELGISKSDVVFRAIKALPEEQYKSLTFEPLQEYLEDAVRKWNMEIHIFSFDMISPSTSRVKIYTRAPNTSQEYLMDALTIGGRNDLSVYSDQVIRDVQDFWNIFTAGAPGVLPQDGSARGPGFYFTTQAGKIPTPKVYISPGPFCKNDMDVLARLRRYFCTRRDTEKMLLQMDNYEQALQVI
ncbi:aromatic prenyltransferase (DMATS family) [Didymella heteroderae]|uniref:Aromatic prenyltransferase (DMATS family) n=1 Tax=Didymella heteroderae TaxID=1769908 RepID=A0A9P5C232_9PLEO|nr:aromatic prenyltransferase (DMATS family) [Didymella heteroderae]